MALPSSRMREISSIKATDFFGEAEVKPNPACAARIQVGVERCLADRVQSIRGLMLVVLISDEMIRKRRAYRLSLKASGHHLR
ncbi:hypothetical protein [Acetobacter aceti]|uniref:hypothetical protein n=1 Tax=Acetobacter aceti TaxID=435 RepID=UPI001044462D|nr:hypothetical protein [Acetobacter aceti]